MREQVTVLVARFEDLVAHGLRALVGEDPHLEIIAADVERDALRAEIGRHAPRVAIVNFGSLRSPAEVHELHVEHPGTRFVVLANRPSPVECTQLLAFGATACLSKETEARDVLNAIHLASRGLQVLPRSAAAGPVRPEPGTPAPGRLTPREAEVLELLQGGRTNAEIAQRLSVGVETIRTHARSIYRKLGVRTRRDLAPPAALPAPR